MAEATHLRLALAQIDPTVGDIEGNVRLISGSIERARDAGAQLVLLPELSVSGYPPEDLMLRQDFLDAARQGLDEIAAEVRGTVALVGFPERVERSADELGHFDPLIDAPPPPAYNSLAVLADGEVRAVYRKCHLPNYGVFDERRYFESASDPALIDVDDVLVGLTVCEDIWHPGFPEADEVAAGAHLVVNARAPPITAARPGPARAWSPTVPAPTAPRSRSATPSEARTNWSSTAAAWSSPRTARRSRAPPSSSPSFSSAT